MNKIKEKFDNNIKVLIDNGFDIELGDVIIIKKYGQIMHSLYMDINFYNENNIVEEFEKMILGTDLNIKNVTEYAMRMLNNNFYDNFNDALVESLRYFKRERQGFVEPLKC